MSQVYLREKFADEFAGECSSLFLDNVYAAAMGDIPWEVPLGLLRERMRLRATALLSLDMVSGMPSAHTFVGESPDWAARFLADYQQNYRQHDPTTEVVSHWAPGRWFDDKRDIGPLQRARGVYHQEYLRTNEIGGYCGFFIQKDPQRSDYLSLLSAPSQTSPGSGERRMLGAMRSHLARALRLQTRLAVLTQKENLADAVLDALDFPVFVVDETRMLMLANTQAHQWIRTEPALRFSSGRFTPEGCSEIGQWRHACTQGTLLLRTSAGSPLLLTLSPVPANTRLAHHWQRPLTLMLGPSMPSQALRVRQLRVLYGLTTTEAELCVLLAFQGLSQQACADVRQVSLNTVRTQIKTIEAKLGVNSMAQVTRMALLLQSTA